MTDYQPLQHNEHFKVHIWPLTENVKIHIFYHKYIYIYTIIERYHLILNFPYTIHPITQ